MDTFTQVVLGAAVGDAVGGRRLGRKAMIAGAVMGLLPDLDIMVGWTLGEWAAIEHHRGPSHSLLILPVVAAIAGWAAWRIDGRRAPISRWTIVAALALLSHPILDVFTSYGTMLLYPLSRQRFALDGIGIVDPGFTILLIAGVAVALWRRDGWQRWATTAALVVTTLYLANGLVVTAWTLHRARGELRAQGFAIEKARALPVPAFTQLRRVIARDAGGDVMVGMFSAIAPRPLRFVRFERPDDPLVGKALATREGRIFEWFADGFVSAEVKEMRTSGKRPPDGWSVKVVLRDLRYGTVPESEWSFFSAQFVFSGKGKLWNVARMYHTHDMDPRTEITAAFRILFGGG